MDPQLGTHCAEGLQSDGEPTFFFQTGKETSTNSLCSDELFCKETRPSFESLTLLGGKSSRNLFLFDRINSDAQRD